MNLTNKTNENNILITLVMKDSQEIADFLGMKNDDVFKRELKKVHEKLLSIVDENM